MKWTNVSSMSELIRVYQSRPLSELIRAIHVSVDNVARTSLNIELLLAEFRCLIFFQWVAEFYLLTGFDADRLFLLA